MSIACLKQHLVVDLANSLLLPSRLHPNHALIDLALSGKTCLYAVKTVIAQSVCIDFRLNCLKFCTHDENELHTNPETLRVIFIKYSRTLIADSTICTESASASEILNKPNISSLIVPQDFYYDDAELLSKLWHHWPNIAHLECSGETYVFVTRIVSLDPKTALKSAVFYDVDSMTLRYFEWFNVYLPEDLSLVFVESSNLSEMLSDSWITNVKHLSLRYEEHFHQFSVQDFHEIAAVIDKFNNLEVANIYISNYFIPEDGVATEDDWKLLRSAFEKLDLNLFVTFNYDDIQRRLPASVEQLEAAGFRQIGSPYIYRFESRRRRKRFCYQFSF